MLTVREQKIILEMYRKCVRGNENNKEYDIRFNREQLRGLGLYLTESGLSRALRSLDMHFLIDRMEFEKPIKADKKELKRLELDARRSEREFDKMIPIGYSKIKLPNGTFLEMWAKKGEEDKRTIREIVNERMKIRARRLREYKKTPRTERIRYRLTKEGRLLGRIFLKNEKWRRAKEL
jgi:hypothetical protein